MKMRMGLAATLLALAAFTQAGGTARAGARRWQARDQITGEINENRRVVLRGNTRPEARREHDRGKVPDDFPLEHMLLQLRRPPELQQEFDAYVESLSQGSSPNFHQWLSPADVGDLYGLSDSDLRHIEHWLKRHGIRVNFVYPNRVLMDISAEARDLRDAMRVEIHFLDVNGEKHFANLNDPEIPEALAPAVLGIVAIHDFKPHSMLHSLTQPAYSDPNGNFLLVPADLTEIYNVNPVFNTGITGAGQTIVVVEDSDPYTPPGMTDSADWTTFVTTFDLAKYGGSVMTTHPNVAGNPNCSDPGVNGDVGEVQLDMQWATAAAPGAAIVVATCGTAGGVFIAIENVIASNPHPYIMSVSYGECEPALGAAGNAALNSAFQTAVSEGISVFVAAGDQGAASCDGGGAGMTAANGINVSGFATTPFNVAVGGTDYGDTFAGANATYWSATNSATLQSAMSYIPEIPWNGSCASVLIALFVNGSPLTYGSGGGFCGTAFGGFFQSIAAGSGGPSGCATGVPTISTQVSGTCAGYAKPVWQSGLFGNPNDGVRDIPDVSLFAASGAWGHFYVFCLSDTSNGGAACTNPPNPAGAPATWSGAGGTSFASPILAGFQALVNQRTHALTLAPTPGQGNPNAIYYAIAKAEYGGAGNAACNSSNPSLSTPRRGVETNCVFYDVTQGDMNVNCTFGTPNCFGATAGNSDGALSTGGIAGFTFTAGAGYTSAPACTISAPHNSAYNGGTGPVQATCTATINNGTQQVTAVNVVNPGSGYAPLPICTLAGGGGAGATCTVTGITKTDYEPAFPTTLGYDFATGIGTVNVRNLVFNSMWRTGT